MASIRYSPRAERDLRDIWRTIAIDSMTAADRLILRIIDKLELAATQPAMGVARGDLGAEARLLIVQRYIVIYEPSPSGIDVIAILHGMRDPQHWLDQN
ncbi:type II toxin-antitoxin system RelE/ParE family toxin [Aquibium carbonis]|uniref:Type II toxin-antitoxin system RelE/ParE family toxin n=1 Tax=Aquibium carbonis TaxID=2495581 RepID=A0A3S0GBK4_9HYPH|nr:type II toxin-antitoxin system RelE/ParE family toxin [Aquibium carbonis]RST88112.1 type II toxin-antitoxin system RelE/ParE family toxin [Aquibium carbonis]